jgi:hypothetical protein
MPTCTRCWRSFSSCKCEFPVDFANIIFREELAKREKELVHGKINLLYPSLAKESPKCSCIGDTASFISCPKHGIK